ncbi:MAG: ECF transporter S component [Christensenellales bacterium]
MKVFTVSKARFLAVTAIMVAVASVLRLLDFSLPILPSFLKMDFSLAPAIISTYALGPLSGFLVVLLTELLAITSTVSSGVGELCNIMLGTLMVVPAGLIYNKYTTFKGAVAGALTGTILMSLLSLVTNYFITYPVYYNFMPQEVILGMYQAILPSVKNIFQCLLIFNLPLTFCKGFASSLITFLLYKRLSPIIKGVKSKSRKVQPVAESSVQSQPADGTATADVNEAKIDEATLSEVSDKPVDNNDSEQSE